VKAGDAESGAGTGPTVERGGSGSTGFRRRRGDGDNHRSGGDGRDGRGRLAGGFHGAREDAKGGVRRGEVVGRGATGLSAAQREVG